MAQSTSSDTLKVALRHAKWRWTGAPLMLTGVLELISAVISLAAGGAGLTVLLSCLGTGMGLASFGANHDTAMAYGVKLFQSGDHRETIPEAFAEEVKEALEEDRAGALDLRPSPKLAMALPFVAISVQAFVAWRLLG